MKRLVSLMLMVTLLSLPTLVLAEEQQKKLTPDQQQELNEIRSQIFELKKQMIEKHVEFGIIDREKADSWLKKMEKAFQRHKDLGYIPCKDKMKKDFHKKHDINVTP